MKRDFKIVLTLIILSLSQKGLSQELPKDNLYFDFYQETWFCPHTNIRFIMERDTTVQYNLCGKIFMYDKGNPIDTLNLKEFKLLKISKTKQLDSLTKDWFVRNDSIIKMRFPSGMLPPISKQSQFRPHVVVSPSEDSYIVYPVRFKFPWN